MLNQTRALWGIARESILQGPGIKAENRFMLSPMVTLHLIPNDIAETYEVHEWRNAAGVLSTAHPTEWEDVIDVLRAFEFRRSEVLKGGGRKSVIAQRIDTFLEGRDWKEKKFATKIRVDAEERDSPTHKVDCFKGRVGLEIEWNNKDPFFDRDLNNFRLLSTFVSLTRA
jgi:Restriction endonuclease BglII